MNDKLFTIREAADILRVSTKTLRRWDQRGRFVPIRTAGNQRRYSQNQIDEFKNSTRLNRLESAAKNNAKSEVSLLQSKLLSRPQAPKELKFTRGLPSALSNLQKKSKVEAPTFRENAQRR